MIVDTLLGRSENRTTVITGAGVSQDAAFKVWTSGAETYAGVEVTETLSLTLSAVYAAVRILSQTPAVLPLFAYKTDREGNKEQLRDHPATWLLHHEPNPEMTALTYRETGQIFLLLWGNSYSYLERDKAGRPSALWPMDAREVKPYRAPNGTIQYDITKLKNRHTNKQVLMAEEVLHVPGLGFDGITGESVIAHAREQLGEALAAQQFSAGFYKGGAEPGLYLHHPMPLSPDAKENFREAWRKHHGSHERKLAILDEGMELKQIGLSQEDAQFLESRKFHVDEVARWFGLPPHRLASLERATFSNISEQKLDFYESLLPWLARWEQECNRKLFTAAERLDHFVEHNVDGLLKADIEKRYNAYAVAVRNGWTNRNEIRRREGWNTMGEEGDVYLVSSDLVPAAQMLEPPEPEPEPEPPAEPEELELASTAA